ncbi:MAG: DUF1538 domain-containing protein [Proteobacteria bacterium]|jgi:hypothetical protein|nr:DUF1538 domain-containing protein [Pseudomonadota bacterium]
MANSYRYGDYAREISATHKSLSYNDLVPKPTTDEHGRAIPSAAPRLVLRLVDVFRILKPYVSVRAVEQLRAVVPLALGLVLFQILILQGRIEDRYVVVAGICAVIVGLMLFLEGLKVGLMPFGEAIGDSLPAKLPLPAVLLVTLLLGVGVTFAEPAIGALKAAGSIIRVEQAPYLYALLNQWSTALVLVVGAGVGVAAVLGTLRFLYGWRLARIIYATIIPTIGLTIYAMLHPHLSAIVGLAWDCGAITTGPVTVPLVLSLGIGVSAAAGRGGSTISGFGIVTLASLFPILFILILGIVLVNAYTPDMIIDGARAAAAAAASQTSIPWYARTPGAEIVMGLRAIVPLLLFLILVMKAVLRKKIRNPQIVAYGVTLAVLGMIVFNLGLTYGLAKLGNQAGGLMPAAFAAIDAVAQSPIYTYSLGIAIALVFAWALGFGATLAEPALNAMGSTVENMTNGAFRKSFLSFSVAVGVGLGIALGVTKIVFDVKIAYLLIPAYAAAVLLTAFSDEDYVNVAWDSAGVTTGPVTVPLVLAIGLGLGDAVSVVEGFGILAMASVCPIVSVLATGLFVQRRIRRRAAERAQVALSEVKSL